MTTTSKPGLPRAIALAALVLFGLGLGHSALAQTPAPPVHTPPRLDDSIEQSQPGADHLGAGREAAFRGRWDEALDHFRTVLDEYPDGELVDDATYWSAHSLNQLGRYQEAVEWANRLIAAYPDSDFVSDARMLRIEACEVLVRGGNPACERYLRADAPPPPPPAQVPDAPRAPDPEAEIRLHALDALISMAPEDAWPILQRLLIDQSDAELRHRAVWLLSQVGTDEAFELLMQLARNDSDPEMRRNALFWVGQSGDHAAEALQFLIELATTSADMEIRNAAIFGLSQQVADQPAARQTLEQIARDSSQPADVRGQALFSLGQGGDGSLALLRDLALNDPDMEVRQQALFGISQVETEEASDFLLEVARSDGPADFRSSAIFFLGQRDDERAVDVLIELWDTVADMEVKNQLLFALSQTEDERAIDHIIAIAKNESEDAELRRQAIFALGQTDHPKAKQALLDIIGGSIQEVAR